MPEQRLTDSAGVLLVALSTGSVAVVYQSTDSWSIPKGHLEAAETLEEAARRELYEETGILHPNIVTCLGTIDRTSGRDPLESKRITVFLGLVDHETPLHPFDDRNPAARWIPFADAIEMLTYREDRAFLRNVQAAVRSHMQSPVEFQRDHSASPADASTLPSGSSQQGDPQMMEEDAERITRMANWAEDAMVAAETTRRELTRAHDRIKQLELELAEARKTIGKLKARRSEP